MTLPDYITRYLRNPLICRERLWHLLNDPQTTLEQLQLDALAPVEMALLIEEHCHQDVADEVYEKWETLADVAETACWFEGVVA
ncbi:hypothetical protein [Novosphingobium sp. B1]|uniref:hypothetical protein n=1 Tax=Novosphingobium sp. B1 TaxID=1938756 RepID=UPI0009D8F4AA|nr:hypothetical protein [Novosphingobium sp. B1]SMC95027.1 hypothetical protein SAMN06272759_11373 [Novosphingobium sp. B1]